MLFVCGKNRWRSPTAEHIFAGREGFEVFSAGLASEAETPLDEELVRWADRIFVMEKRQRTQVQQRFRHALDTTPIASLDIPDRYRFMDPALIALIEARMARFLL